MAVPFVCKSVVLVLVLLYVAWDVTGSIRILAIYSLQNQIFFIHAIQDKARQNFCFTGNEAISSHDGGTKRLQGTLCQICE